MGRNLKKLLCLFLYGIIFAGCITACGTKENTTAGNNIKEVETKKEKKGEYITLRLTNFNHIITEDFIQAFEKVYPEVKLEVTSYAGMNGSGYALHSLEQGDIPDIYITSQNFSKESQKQYLLDLSNYSFINNYSSTLLDSVDVDGSIYLLPSGYTLTGIYYNKTILEENKWEVPTSFQELVALSKKIEAKGYQTMGHGMLLDGFPFNYFFNIGNTVYFATPEGTQWKNEFPKGETNAIGNGGLKETVEYFNQWIKNGFITVNHMDTQQFFEGDCVFFLCLGLSNYTSTKDGKTYEFGTIPWLSEDGSNNMLTRNVSRYIGINKNLAEEGNKKKLEAARKFLDYISTPEGQKAFMASGGEYMSSLNESELPSESSYNEISDLVNQGRTVPLVYVDWEKLIVPIARDIKELIQGSINTEELIKDFDKTRDGILSGASDDIYAECTETLTMEETAELVAIAEGKAVNADCAMISLNEYQGDHNYNAQGLGWYLYKSDVDMEIINLIRPRSTTISVLEMTGAEIKEMQKAGFDFNKNGKPYPYLLFTRNNIELKDTSIYKLAISTGELQEDKLKQAEETEISPAEAIQQYTKSLKTIDANTINWKE